MIEIDRTGLLRWLFSAYYPGSKETHTNPKR